MSLPAAQRLNYDILSAIFILSPPEWKTAVLTLSSVCGLWRYIALSMPQLWNVVDLSILRGPYVLGLFLERSEQLPLHVIVMNFPTNQQLQALSPATKRIVCMNACPSYQLLKNGFPRLERLVLEGRGDIWNPSFSEPPKFPSLRHLVSTRVSGSSLKFIVAQCQVFSAVQSLKIEDTAVWTKVTNDLGNTLVSLHFHISSLLSSDVYRLKLPQLQYLKITAPQFVCCDLVIDAPLLQSIERLMEGLNYPNLGRQNPQSVKYLHTWSIPAAPAPYPGLRKLWLQVKSWDIPSIHERLKDQIACCPQLETIFYFSQARDPEPEQVLSKQSPSVYGPFPRGISALIQESGRDITLQGFLPSQVSLPGSIEGCNKCSEGYKW